MEHTPTEEASQLFHVRHELAFRDDIGGAEPGARGGHG